MILKELLVKLGFDIEGEEKISQVSEQLEGIKTLLEAFAAAEIVKGIYEMTEKFGEMAEQIQLSAVAAGITAEAFQQLAFSAKQSGVSQEELSGAVGRLSRNLYMAKQGSAQAMEAFRQFGITPEQVKGFSNAQDAIHAVSAGVRKLGSTFNAVGPSMMLFGRSSQNMIEWLHDGPAEMKESEESAKKLGAVLTNVQIQALVKVTHAFEKLKAVMGAFAGSIAADLAPEVNAAIDAFIKFYSANKDIIELSLKDWIGHVAWAFGFIFGVTEGLTKKFLRFAKSHRKITTAVLDIITALGVLIPVVTGAGVAWNLFSMAMQPWVSLAKGIKKAIVWVVTELWGLTAAEKASEVAALANFKALAGMTAAETASGTAATTASVGFWAMLAPILAVTAAIGAVVLAAQSIYAAFTGKPAWIMQFLEFIGIGKKVEEIMFSIFDYIGSISNKLIAMGAAFGEVFSKIADTISKSTIGKFFSGFLQETGIIAGPPNKAGAGYPMITAAPADNAIKNINAATTLPTAGPAAAASLNNNISNQMAGNTINTQITVNASPGMNTEQLASQVADKHAEHLDRILRETSRSLRSQLVY